MPVINKLPEVVLPESLTANKLQAIQHRLFDLGYQVGIPDGEFGPSTYSSLSLFQILNNLEETGIPNEETLAVLGSHEAIRKPISERRERIETIQAENYVPSMRDSRRAAFISQSAGYLGGFMGIILLIVQFIAPVKMALDPIIGLASDTPSWVWTLIILLFSLSFGLAAYFSNKSVRQQLQDFRSGNINGHPVEDTVPPSTYQAN